jgi:2-dehydropantoate 2-reductase
MRFAIMGSGGLGSYFGGLLTRAGHDVHFIARGAKLDALRDGGLTVKLLPEDEFRVAVRATDDPAEVGPVDVVWVCVKAYDVDAAAPQIAPLMGPDTMVLPIQNGVEAPERLGRVLGPDPVLGGVVVGGATLVAPGVVAQKTPGVAPHFGELGGGTSARVEGLLQVMREAGIDAQLSQDVQALSWEKLALACMTVGLTALTRLPLGPIFASPGTRELAGGVLAEAEAVGRAKGHRLGDGMAERLFEMVHQRALATPAAAGSMYFDLIEGRRLELDALNGAIVRMGRDLGVATPLNFAVYAALEPYAAGAPSVPNLF